ncbi:MAG: ImmA/IrrE family metallo-endopeptidase [Ignavibacteria bacterium]|nr:ImmA/IrrE family metallo-endopeptidase [Ignavibacteria bacterium]
MKHERRHRIAQEVLDWVYHHCFKEKRDCSVYPVSFETLSGSIRESLRLVVQPVPQLDISKITGVLGRLQLPFESGTMDRYWALAGFLYAYQGGGIIFIEETDPEERRKFSLAHELGHFINDYYRPVYLKYESSSTIPLFQEEGTVQSRQVVSARCTKRDIFGGDEPEFVATSSKENMQLLAQLLREQKEKFKEIKANYFAAELLMPMEECKRIEHECEGKSRGELTAALTKRFGVSRSAAAIRVEELKLGVVEERLL